jgi:hypothetical protein
MKSGEPPKLHRKSGLVAGKEPRTASCRVRLGEPRAPLGIRGLSTGLRGACGIQSPAPVEQTAKVESAWRLQEFMVPMRDGVHLQRR